MPAPSTSRRKPTHRRRLDSDIEEDESTQKNTKALEGSRPKKPSKGKGHERPPQVPGDGDDPMGEDDNDVVDVDNFEDQPLSKADMGKFRGLSQDWNSMASKIRQNWSVVGEVAAAMADSAEGTELEKGLSELETVIRGLIDIDAEMSVHSRVLEAMHQELAQGEPINDCVDRYISGTKKLIGEYQAKTTRQKFAKNDGYLKFRQGIYEAQHQGSAMPPITEILPQESGDISDDDELEVGGVTQNYTCPITLTPLVDPLTSSVCGHSFSAEAIRQTFSTGHPTKKCPATGCNKSFSLSQCNLNKDLAKKVKAWQRRSQRTEEGSDAEEIVD